MRDKFSLLAGVCATAVCATAVSTPVFAKDAAPESSGIQEIIVTAQRQAQRLQDVPIAVTAFTAQNLERQQIKNTSDLQLSLPSVTFTKTNFTSSSFTIRGIGDLCVGVSCDSATAIHLNDAPLFQTRLFEGEFYDLAQVEVLRGPQGTLYGRNATSGVVNFKTAQPNLNKLEASGDVEYGNYNSIKVKGMINIPLTQTLGIRAAGFYLKRDGYTTNLYNNSKIDDRDMYGFRGSLKWEPTPTTTIDIVGQYFHEKDSRMRIQKQLCQADPTGVLGCLNARRDNSITNANATLAGILTSKEFFALKGLPSSLALGSVYGPDLYSTSVNPADPRQVYTAFTPRYYSEDAIIQGTLKQELGDKFNLRLEGNWERVTVDSMQDYNNAVQDRSLIQPALNTLAFLAGGGGGAGLATYLSPVANALMPNGPTGDICTSLPDETGTGVYGGHSQCSNAPLSFDRSRQTNVSWTAEAVLSSKFDGPFNFLLGGIYGRNKLNVNDYYVDSFGLDYFSGIVGTFSALGAHLPPAYLATPYYDNNSNYLLLKTYGIFGEAYFKASDKVKLTVGLRYNDDKKNVSAHTTLFNWLTPFNSTNAYTSPYAAGYNADPNSPTPVPNALASGHYRALTGRAVLDWQITPDNLLYASYSRGYKSGGINPPLSNIFSVPTTFQPEFVNAFEIGSKNTFGNGKLQLNLTGFYYIYQDLQLSRIVARTSVNDNVNAHIYGVEAEAIIRPVRPLTFNVSFSYLHTAVSSDKFLANPRDFGGGRSDAVIIKDLTNAANCAVVPTSAGSAAGTVAYVNAVNATLGLQPATAFPSDGGIASKGAFGVCDALKANAAAANVEVLSDGVKVNIRGNQLPGAPTYKLAAGVQYEFKAGDSGLTVTPRVDFAYTGESTGSIFNGAVNEIPNYAQVNAQIQIDGPGRKWYLRAFVQNLTNDNSITGLYVTDQSSGNFTNIFTLDPRRFGVAAGVKF